MKDTEILISCPNCESIDIREPHGLFRTSYEGGPGEPPKEKKYTLFRCRECSREFDERETIKMELG